MEEGLEERFERHDLYAEAIRAGLAALGFGFFTEPDFLAPTLSVVRYPDGVDDKAFRAGLGRERRRRRRRLGPDRGRRLPHGPHGQPDLGPGPVRPRRRGEDPRGHGPGGRAGDGTPGRRRRPQSPLGGPVHP
ncbi:MAG: hypothetical protein M0C28_02420 [Candidatus Moduliflexus flocculans]|nr:hypothetical protein [Candidatus Moduliflexus flocculans]